MSAPEDDRTAADPGAPSPPGRRQFLGVAAATLGACAGASLLLPLATSVLAPVGRRTVKATSDPVDVGAESDFEPDRPRRVVLRGAATDGWETADVELGSAWVTRHASGGWTAFATACPHLGCVVDAPAAEDRSAANPYFCQCHESAFAADGSVKSGPSPRGLDALPITVVDGRVRVEFHRYVLNRPEKVEA